MAKEAFNKKKTLICSRKDLELRKRVVKCCCRDVKLMRDTRGEGERERDNIELSNTVWRKTERIK